jgi:hypothetical protein
VTENKKSWAFFLESLHVPLNLLKEFANSQYYSIAAVGIGILNNTAEENHDEYRLCFPLLN